MNNVAIRRTATQFVVTAVLFVAQTGSFMQVLSAAHERGQVAQYCAPPEPEFDAPRCYCRDESRAVTSGANTNECIDIVDD
jgi:hypothetical protein